MSAIPASDIRLLFQLSASFYARGEVCPPMVALNKWVVTKLAESEAAPAPQPATRPSVTSGAPAAIAAGAEDAAAAAEAANGNSGDAGDAGDPPLDAKARAKAEAAKFDEATLAALRSSPNGVSTSDLKAILAHHNKDGAVPGSLGRLKRAELAEKRGELWHYSGPDIEQDPAPPQGRIAPAMETAAAAA